MFTFTPETLDTFAAYKATFPEAARPFEAADFEELEALWGFALPKAYRHLMQEIGPMPFPDEGQTEAIYRYEDAPEQSQSASFAGLMPMSSLRLMHRHLMCDAGNDTQEPFIPPSMLPFGSDPGQNLFLLDLQGDVGAVWFWRDDPDAFGRGGNTRLGCVAPDLKGFIAALH